MLPSPRIRTPHLLSLTFPSRRLPADRRQARHQGIPDQGRGRAGEAYGAAGARTGEDRTDGKKHHVTTTVNGDEYEFLCEAQQTLLDVLRDELMLSRHQGRLRHRRLRRLHRDDRRRDGLLLPRARRSRPTAPRSTPSKAWRRATSCIRCSAISSSSTALQCGICTPGILIAARALLERNPDPTETEIRYWLAGNLCRCTGYDKIIRSVQAAAKEMRGA